MMSAPHPFRIRRSGPLLVACLLLSALRVPAQPSDPEATRARLLELEAELSERARHQRALADQAEALGREAESLSRRVIAITADVQALEERLAAILIKIDSLEEMLAEQKAALARRREQAAEVLAALQRLAKRPADLALLQPDDAERTMKSALLLRELVPQLQAIARSIGDQVQRIETLGVELDQQKAALGSEADRLERRRAEADALRRKREDERRRTLVEAEDEARAMDKIAREAKTLEELLAALDAERERRRLAAEEAARKLGKLPLAPPVSSPITTARGTLPLPARGRVVTRFGAHDGPVAAKGITIATLPGAQVVAPYDGRVLFSGPFRGYGRLLIIDHGEGYHSLLAGLESVYVSVGQWVLAGEPVGLMAQSDQAAATGAPSAERGAKLYVELREGGQPVDPLPWMATGSGKVS